MYELIASPFGVRTLHVRTLEPEEPEGSGPLTINTEDQSNEGSGDDSSSDDD
jgi:hypothetical protein